MISRRRLVAKFLAHPLGGELERIVRRNLSRLPGVLGRKAREYFVRVDDARGYVWAPYMPIHRTPPFLDPDDFNLSDEAKARYSKVKVRHDWYGKIKLDES